MRGWMDDQHLAELRRDAERVAALRKLDGWRMMVEVHPITMRGLLDLIEELQGRVEELREEVRNGKS